MDDYLRTVVAALQQQYGLEVYEFRGEVSLIVPPEQALAVASCLRDEHQFTMLVVETAVDYWPQETPRFHVVCRLYSLDRNVLLGLRVPLNGNHPGMPTLESVFPNANWHEREIWDMFGIRFEGHSDPRRILMPADWQGHPLRKDYPLGYEEVQFTFNADEIRQRKPYAQRLPHRQPRNGEGV